MAEIALCGQTGWEAGGWERKEGGAGCGYVTMLRASAGAMGNAIENVLLPVSLWQEEVTKLGITVFPAFSRSLLVPSAASSEWQLAAHRLCFPFSLSAARFLVLPSKTCPSLRSRPNSTPAESMTSTETPSSLTG